MGNSSEVIIFGKVQTALGTPFDNATNGFSAEDAQAAIEEAAQGGGSIVLFNVPCDASVFVNAAVRMSAGGTAFNAISTAASTSNVIGIVESKASSVLCNIRVTGVTDAVFTLLDVTKEYFLSASSAGELTTSPPVSSGEVVVRIGQPFSATEFLVNKGTPIVRA